MRYQVSIKNTEWSMVLYSWQLDSFIAEILKHVNGKVEDVVITLLDP